MKKNEAIVLASLLVILCLTGCHYARGPLFKSVEVSPSDKALVYVYRPLISHFSASKKYSPYLFVDDTKIVPMELGGYTIVLSSPGKHLFEIRDTLFFGLISSKTLDQIEIPIEEGKEYYLSFEQTLGNFNPASIAGVALVTAGINAPVAFQKTNRLFRTVPKDVAVPELQKTRYLGPDRN